MSTTRAGNVTKFVAGGSGDNIIADGYIRTVEKVWIDSYTIAFTGTNETIEVAVIPENKKITSIECQIYTTLTQTSGTVSIGYSVDSTDDLAPTGVSNFMAPHTITHNLTRTSISLPGGIVYSGPTTTSSTTFFGAMNGFQGVTAGTQVTVAVKLNNWIMTTGTLKTIVRYT